MDIMDQNRSPILFRNAANGGRFATGAHFVEVVMPEAHERLTELDKAAIQSYLLKIFIPSATVLSILSATLGFLVNQWAFGAAYVKAYGEASSEIVKIASAVGSVKGEDDATPKRREIAVSQQG